MSDPTKLSPLARRLKLARETAGLEPEQVAVRLSMTAGAIRHWENDTRKPTLKHIAPLARIYKVSTDWILTGLGQGPDDPETVDHELLDTWADVPANDRPKAMQALKIFATRKHA